MGFTLKGMFCNYSEFVRDDGKVSASVIVATEKGSYKVYLEKPQSDVCGLFEIGDTIEVECRPYLTSRNTLGFGGGRVVVDE